MFVEIDYKLQVCECVGKFKASEKGASETYGHISRVPLPHFTVCPALPYKGLTNVSLHARPMQRPILHSCKASRKLAIKGVFS